MKYTPKPATSLTIVTEGDMGMLNPYGYIAVNKAKHPHVKADYADALGKWLLSDKGKTAIKNFKVSGKQLFFPDPLPTK